MDLGFFFLFMYRDIFDCYFFTEFKIVVFYYSKYFLKETLLPLKLKYHHQHVTVTLLADFLRFRFLILTFVN